MTTIAPGDLAALAPLLVLAATAVLVMLLAAFRRDHATAAGLTALGLVLAIVTLLPLADAAVPRAVTELLVIDRYSLFFIGLVCAAALAVTLLAYAYFDDHRGHREELYVLLLTATLGAAVLAASRHFAALFLGLELVSVSLFALVAYPVRQRRPVEAALKYLVLSGLASGLLAFGMALMYYALGSLEFARMTALARPHLTEPALVAGFALTLAGLGFKLALVPFHLWTPDVYQGAPAPVAAFLATVSKGAVAALLLRYLLETGGYRNEAAMLGLEAVAIASILAGNLLALLQQDLKRILAYSSIAHLGYLLIAFLAAGEFGAEAAGYYLVAYFVMTLGAFGVVSRLSSASREGDLANLADYAGLAWRRPWLAATLTGMLLALAGMPLTVGFVAKFYVFAAGVAAALWPLVAALVIGSVLGLFYYVRVIALLFARPDATARAVAVPAGAATASIALGALALALVALGVYPEPVIEFARLAAVALQ